MTRASRTSVWAWLAASLLVLTACAGDTQAPASTAPPTGSDASGQEARTLPIPGQELPEGHPPLEGGSASGNSTGPLSVAWDVPEGWVDVPPTSSMRKAQYRVPGPAGDGECAVFFFGVGQGGDPMANAARWAGQFVQPDGQSSEDVMKMQHLQAGDIEVLEVEVTGTYDGGMTMTDEPAKAMDNYMLLGGMTMPPTAAWFFKFTGPEATVKAERDAFEGMLKSIRPAE